MSSEIPRNVRLLSQVLSHIDSVLDIPERRSAYPQLDAQHAQFSPAVEMQPADNLRVSVGLARHYAVQHLRDGLSGLQSLKTLFEGSGFAIHEEDEQIAIVGQHFVIDQIEPRVQSYVDSR